MSQARVSRGSITAAVVTDEQALGWFVRLVRPALKGEIRTFHRGELEAARAWIREPA